MLQLLDWFYSVDRSGALIVFPRGIDRWNMASLIVSDWDRYRIVIVTDQADDFMQTIIEASETSKSNRGNYQEHWKHVDSIPFSLLSYRQLDDINRMLHHTEVDLVLFDDARMLATVLPALDLHSIQPKLIVLTSWGDTALELDSIQNDLHLSVLSIRLISDTTSLQWKNIMVSMSSRQLQYYSSASENQRRMISLYAYPDPLMADTLTEAPICEFDQINLASWISSSYLDSMEADGPKLAAIIDGVSSEWPSKQIVLTRYNHRYGVDLITSFLRLSNPYDSSEIYSVSCTDDYSTMVSTLHRFNQAESGVLVTNLVPLIPLRNISILHVADTYCFSTLVAMIDRCYKRYLNSNPLTICAYVAILSSDEPSADLVGYQNLVSKIEAANGLYTHLTQSSSKVVFDPERGLIVI